MSGGHATEASKRGECSPHFGLTGEEGLCAMRSISRSRAGTNVPNGYASQAMSGRMLSKPASASLKTFADTTCNMCWETRKYLWFAAYLTDGFYHCGILYVLVSSWDAIPGVCLYTMLLVPQSALFATQVRAQGQYVGRSVALDQFMMMDGKEARARQYLPAVPAE